MQLTPEQLEDAKTRSIGFMEEYDKLIQKYQVQIGCLPRMVSLPNDLYAFKIDMGPTDLKYLPTPSPLSDSVIQQQ